MIQLKNQEKSPYTQKLIISKTTSSCRIHLKNKKKPTPFVGFWIDPDQSINSSIHRWPGRWLPKTLGWNFDQQLSYSVILGVSRLVCFVFGFSSHHFSELVCALADLVHSFDAFISKVKNSVILGERAFRSPGEKRKNVVSY